MLVAYSPTGLVVIVTSRCSGDECDWDKFVVVGLDDLLAGLAEALGVEKLCEALEAALNYHLGVKVECRVSEGDGK